MNCIEAAEGTAKAILLKNLDLVEGYSLDVSEYIRNVKAIIEAAATFAKTIPDSGDWPEALTESLYFFAKKQWLARMQKNGETEPSQTETADIEYQAYCYDYIYTHGNYPR